MSIYKIEFSAICQTVPGELVYICGNVTELGNWQPLKSLRLYTEDSLYPKWNSYQTIQIREDSKLLFKLCVIKDGTIIRWQNLPGNRQILAKSDNYVQFTEAVPQLIFSSMPQIQIKSPRKKTKDIINELASQGSSSQQYWKQFRQEEDTVLYITLTNDMRKLIQSQNSESFVKISKKPYIKFRKHKQQIIELQEKFQKCVNIFLIHKTNEQQKSINNKIHWIKEESLQNYRIPNSKQCSIFYINCQLSSLSKNTDLIKKIMHKQNLILNNLKEKTQKQIHYYIAYELQQYPQIKHIKEIIKNKISVMFIHNQTILNLVIQLFNNLGYFVSVTQGNELVIKLQFSRQILLVFKQKQKLKQQSTKQVETRQVQQLAEFLQTLIVNQNNYTNFKSYSQFQQDIREDSLFVNFEYNRNIKIIIQMSNLQKLPMKCITQLISLSSKKKIQVYIICHQKLKDLEHKFPLSNKDKIVFLNYNGCLYANSQKVIDLYSNLCMPKLKFQQNLQFIQSQIKFGLLSKQRTQNGFVFHFHKNNIGKMAKQLLIFRIVQLNQNQIFKLCWKDYHNIIQVIPFCISSQFYYQAILENVSKFIPEQSCLIVNISFKEGNRSFQICQQTLKLNQNIVCNYKVKNYQIVDKHQKGLYQHETITSQMLEYLLQYMNQHMLAGSNIKSYDPLVFSANLGAVRRSLRPNVVFPNTQ